MKHMLNKSYLKNIIKIPLIVLMLLFFSSCSSQNINNEIKDTIDDPNNTSEIADNKTIINVVNDEKELIVKDSNIELENPNSSEKNVDLGNKKFEIHFIDVGQGDSALVICDDQYLLIDGGPSSASSLIYTYLKNLNITYLDYVICSHPDEDHVGGLSGALNYASLGTAYSPCSKDTRAYDSFIKYTKKHNVEIQVPNIGDSFKLGSADVDILACNIGNDNETSIVTKITYGNNSFLFMGDAGTVVEDYLINKNVDIKCDVLKVGHHGSKYSTGYQFLYLSEPKYAIISVGKGNSYGHPTEEVLSKLRDADVKTFRTDLQGDIVCVSDGNTITFTTKKNADIDTYKEVGTNSIQRNNNKQITSEPVSKDTNEYKYCLNKNTKKFHYSYCSSVRDMKESNKKYTNDDRETIIAQGYVPCKRCNP